jgi:hypothetical protein
MIMNKGGVQEYIQGERIRAKQKKSKAMPGRERGSTKDEDLQDIEHQIVMDGRSTPNPVYK